MNNKVATLLLVGMLVGAMALGHAAHLVPSGRPQDGLRLLLAQAKAAVARTLRAVWLWLFCTVWVMETVRNLLQAVLLSGAGVAGYMWNNASDLEWLTTPANVVGFVVFGALMGLATRRAEQLRERSSKADLEHLFAQAVSQLTKLAEMVKKV